MARHFTAAAGDYIDLGAGSAGSVDGGPSSVAVLWRPTTVHEGWLLDAENGAGGHAYSINPYTDGHLWHTMVGFRQTMAYTASDGWRLDIWSKPSGTAAVRGHTMLLSAGTWSHADYGTSADSANVPTTRIRIGRHFSSSGALNGDVAAAMVVGAEWSDAAVEAGALGSGLAAWLAMAGASPAAVWGFGQSSVSDPVTDVTGGGGDQIALSGTSVTTDPPGFSYAIAATDCSVSVGLPALLAGAGVSSRATVAGGLVMPALDVHAAIGAPLLLPAFTAAAVVRDLSGTASVR